METALRLAALRRLGFTPMTARPARDLGDTAVRVAVGALFLMLAQRLAAEFLRTGHVTGLLLLTSELLVVILMVIRRPAAAVDRTWPARLITAASMTGPPLLRTVSTSPMADGWSAAISGFGLLLIVLGKLSLGRSFGLVPANRGVVSSGLYRFVRHPIYAGYLVTHVGFCLAHPAWWNVLLLGASDAALLARSWYEERTLGTDPAYAAYRACVRWRIAPGLF